MFRRAWWRGNRGDALWLRGKSVPRGATRMNENDMVFENAIAEVSPAREPPDARLFARLVPSELAEDRFHRGASLRKARTARLFCVTNLRHYLSSLSFVTWRVIFSRVAGSLLGRRHKAGPRRYRDAGERRHPRHGLAHWEPAPLPPPPRPCGWGAPRWLRTPPLGLVLPGCPLIVKSARFRVSDLAALTMFPNASSGPV